MSWDIRLDLGAFEPDQMSDHAQMDALETWIAALVHTNRLWLPFHPKTPPLYASGVVFVPDDSAFEPGFPNWWRDIPTTLALGHGHCVALAAWRLAELQEQGERTAKLRIEKWLPSHGGTDFHIQLLRSNGTIEDPAKRLGMP